MTILREPLPLRLTAALDVVRAYRPEVDLELYLVRVAAGEAISRESRYGDTVTTHTVTL